MTITHATGYAIMTPGDINFKLTKYELEPLEDDRVTVAVECCGVCGSDNHTISGGWGPFETKFVVTGHEVIGKIVEVGKKVTEFKVGQRVGVGAQVGSCGQCKACKNDNENYCAVATVDGYNSCWPDKHEHQGGYSTHIRAQEKFTFAIPDAIPSVEAASMLCGGLTVFSPLVRNGAGPGKKVGVVGLGGLGHYAVLFGTALGAEITVFSRSDVKKEDAFKLGAKRFVATTSGFEKDLQREFDLIIVTASSSKLPLDELLSTLDVGCKLVFVGMPEEGLSNITSQTLSGNAAALASSHIGCKPEAMRMLEIAADQKVKPWINVMPMKDAANAIKAVADNSVRYRSVLTQDIEA